MKMFKRFLPLLCAALLIIGSSMTVFASEEYPYPEELSSYKYQLTFLYSTTPFSIGSDVPITVIRSDEGADRETFCFHGQYFYGALHDKVTTSYSNLIINDIHYVYSNHDIIDQNNKLVFQKPLEPIATLAVPVGQTVQSQVVKILPAAVGCLALLIGSIVLLPRLRSFL